MNSTIFFIQLECAINGSATYDAWVPVLGQPLPLETYQGMCGLYVYAFANLP